MSPERPRSLPLDVLRAIAILLVLGRHILWAPRWDHAHALDKVFLAWRQFGWAGVDLFFVLSGFLVGGLLLRETQRTGAIRPGTFLLRRGFKIYPAFYFFLFVSPLIAHAAGLGLSDQPHAFYAELFFVQNYLPGLWPQTWSLAVEEHFYLLLLGLFLWLTRRGAAGDPFTPLPRIVLGINLLILLSRTAAVAAWHVPADSVLVFTHWRLDSLFFGVLLSYEYHYHRERLTAVRLRLRPWRPLFLPLLLLPPCFLDFENSPYVYTLGFTSLYLGFGWILVDAVLGDSMLHDRLFNGLRFLAPIGRASYSTYLWHVLVYYVVVSFIRGHMPGAPFTFDASVYMLCALAAGGAMYLLIEQPVIYLRDRLVPAGKTV